MALSKTLEYKGIPVPNAYIKVWRFAGNKDQIHFDAGFHSAEGAEMFESKAYSFNLDLNGDNPVKQAYLYLKTLPEFVGSVDC